MSRSTAHWFSPAFLLTVLVALLVLLSFLPARAIGWARALASPVEMLVAPARHPLRSLAVWIAPAERVAPSSDPAVRELETQRQELLHLSLQLQEENNLLRRQISDLSRGLDLNPSLAVRQYTAPVIGGTADRSSATLTVRAGAREGVERNAVAVIRGVHLVGRVTRVDDRLAYVLPITDASAKPIKGVIMLSDRERGPTCLLEPTGRGQLRGRVEDTGGGGPPPALEPGMVVRLLDPDVWPASAQMLIVGRVISVEPLPQQPLRRMITVEPEFRIDRASTVTLRLLEQASGPALEPAAVPERRTAP